MVVNSDLKMMDKKAIVNDLRVFLHNLRLVIDGNHQ
jgi:hypothetical protein